VKPDIAWSRANQAVNLLGPKLSPGAVQDRSLRRSAHLTCVEIAFCLAMRGEKLSPQLGAPNLWSEATRHAYEVGDNSLRLALGVMSALQQKEAVPETDAIRCIATLGEMDRLEPWMRIEFQPAVEYWAVRMEGFVKRSELADEVARALPGYYKLFEVADFERRTRDIRLRAVDTLLTAGEKPAAIHALELLDLVPDADPLLRARAVEATGRFADAAEMFVAAGALEKALHCYRSIPDFEKSLEIAEKLGNVPAAESLLWLDRMRKLAGERPSGFNKLILPTEKKMLEDVLETALGATRRKPGVRKAVAKKTAAKKPAVKNAIAGKAAK
jgi:tetratricopeptide (TPR) repeat protein